MSAMATFRLVLPDFPFSACLAELRACYSDALRRAGHACTLADTYLDAGEAGEDFQLAFGAHAVAPPADAERMIIAQSEHHARHFTDAYGETLRAARLVMNMGPFPACKADVECPPGIMAVDDVDAVSSLPLVKNTWSKPAPERDIDVLFYGSITPRRARILESLSAAGIQVTALYGVLGAERDRYIDRAKVVLDLKQDGDEPPDCTRSWWALSRGALTLSENATGTAPRSVRITPDTVVNRVQRALAARPEWRDILLGEYATALGPCDVSPLLAALGLAAVAP